METPFIFGKIATEKNFTDREKETADLVQNFMSLINTIIISPRRWGKSSLVNKAAKLAMAQDSNLPLPQNGRRQSRVRRLSFRALFPKFQSVQTTLMRFQLTLIGRR